MLTDKQDYEEIYQKYKNLVMKAAYKYSGNYDIAEDITQSTFLQLYMYIDELKDINIKAWMYTTAKHMALNYNKKAEREVLSETGEDPAILDLEDSAEDTYMERMKDDEQTSLHEEILQPCTSIIHVGMMQFVMYITWRFRSLLLQKEWR